MRRISFLFTLATVGALIAGPAASAFPIYTENFDGPSGTNLDGTTPNQSVGGNTWDAHEVFDADGIVDTGTDSRPKTDFAAYLDIPSLQSDKIYTVEPNIASMEQAFLYFGLTDAASPNPDDRFQIRDGNTHNIEVRFNGGETDASYFYNGGDNGSEENRMGTTAISSDDFPLSPQLTIDTTSGLSDATIEFSLHGETRASRPGLDVSGMTHLGMGVEDASGGDTEQALNSLSYTVVPTPGTLPAALVVIGGAATIRRRRA